VVENYSHVIQTKVKIEVVCHCKKLILFSSKENDFRKAITFCENGKFAEAKPLLQI
jgi:hypothetical protein